MDDAEYDDAAEYEGDGEDSASESASSTYNGEEGSSNYGFTSPIGLTIIGVVIGVGGYIISTQ